MSKIQKQLEQEGKNQIKAALNDAGIEGYIDIDNLDPDEDENIQEGEEPVNYPEDDPFERDPMDLAKDRAIERHMRGY